MNVEYVALYCVVVIKIDPATPGLHGLSVLIMMVDHRNSSLWDA